MLELDKLIKVFFILIKFILKLKGGLNINKKQLTPIIFLITLLLCLNTAYATDDTNNTATTQKINQEPIQTIEETPSNTVQIEKNNPQTTKLDERDTKEISKGTEDNIQTKKNSEDNKKTESQNYKIINDTTYSNYFSTSGNIIGDTIKNGDTIDIKGIISNKNFNINRQVNFTSTSNGKIINGTIKLSSGADNSIISNLYIQNSQEKGIGIFLMSVSYVKIANNILIMNGTTGYGITASHSNHLQIINNTITQKPTSSDSVHNAIIFGDCHYNTISKNKIEITKISTVITTHNGIYFSTYGNPGVNFEAGVCNYNNITDNIIKGVDTTMCYTIQVMGNDNIIQNNTVFEGAIGISSVGVRNKIINNTIHATNTGMVVGNNNIVMNNKINLTNGAEGILSYANDSTIQNNKITTTNKHGIHIEDGSNNTIKANTIETKTGNGIYLKGNIKNNKILGNTITSNAIGIMFKKESKKIYPANNTITHNSITTTAQYTVDAYESDNTIFYYNDDLISAMGSGDITVKPSSTNSGGFSGPISGKTYILNDTTYSNYFNIDGSLKNDIIGNKDIFNITGPLYNKNMTINIPITINGINDAILYNSTIKILSDGAETIITNVKIINDNQIGIIVYETEFVNIENNIIIVNQIVESYGIYIHSSDFTRVINNTIYSYGDYVNFGIFLYRSDKNKILKNHVNTISNNNSISYQTEVMLNENIGSIPEIFNTYGIVAIYSSNNQINENKVNLTSLFKEPQNVSETCMNSMVGIDIYYDSHENTVNNNEINVIGNNPYSYGMGVLGSKGHGIGNAKKNIFENNNVTVYGNYFATGFIAGLGSIDTVVKNNRITSNSNTFTYGITLEASQESTINSNKINLTSPAIYGIEMYSSNKNIIYNNEINVTGYYKYGMAGYSSTENEISNNIIQTKNEGIQQDITNVKHGDAIPLGDSGILLIWNSTNNLIKSNEIISASYCTINISHSENNTVTENLLINKDNLGTNSTISEVNNQIYNNGAYNLIIETDSQDLSSKAGQTITINAKVNSTSGNVEGINVTFQIGSITIGTITAQEGIAKITYKIPNTWSKGYRDIKIIANKEDHLTKTLTLPAIINGLEIRKPDTYTLNDTTYSNYFNIDGSLNQSIVGANDVFNINGPIYNKNLTIDMPIIINGISNAILYNTTITIINNGSQTTISNIKIINNNQIGIILNETKSNTIKNNEIIINQSVGIILFENSALNLIKLNKIVTYYEYTINMSDTENNRVTENSLISKDKIGDKSVINTYNNQIYNNEGYKLSIDANDINSNPGKTITLKAIVSSTNGNSDDVLVTFKIGSTIIGTTTVKNGIAEIDYNVPSNLSPGKYDITVTASGKYYLNKTVIKTLNLKEEIKPVPQTPKTSTSPKQTTSKNKVTITTAKATITISKKAKKLVLSAKLKIDNKISKSKTVTYIINGKKYKVKTNKKGVAKLTLKKATLKNILKKVKVGKKIKYQIKYGKKTITKYIKVKK